MLSCHACDAPAGDDMRYCSSCGEPLQDDLARRTKRESRVIPEGTILGSYRLLNVLGEGGMGRVYLAEHVKLGRRVALKMLRTKFSNNPESVARFFAEARAVNRIAHENIVEITDFVSNEDGADYYIMELLTGTTLSDAVAAAGHLPLERTLAVATQVASALAAVHKAGIVHRDLKPDNIFLCQRGSRRDIVKLLDFGIAKLIQPDAEVSMQHTGAGMVLGTPTYMSPEQAGGLAIDFKSDIYSLGIILYELLSGAPPFDGETYAQILVGHLTQEPKPLQQALRESERHQGVPPALEALVSACLAKRPENRPANTAEIESTLQEIRQNLEASASSSSPRPPSSVDDVEGPPVGAAPATLENTAAEVAPRTTGRRRLAIVAGLVVVVGVAAAGLALRNSGGTNEAPATNATPAAAATASGETRPAAAANLAAAPAITNAATTNAAATTPAAPATAKIRFRSTPQGADVFRVGDTESLGQTPLEVDLPRTGDRVGFELRKAGYVSATQEIRLDKDAIFAIGLVPVAAKAPSKSPGKARPPARQAKPVKQTTAAPKKTKKPRTSDRALQKGDVLDVFGD